MAKTIEIDTEGYSVVFKLSPEGTTFRMGIVDAGRRARAVLKACKDIRREAEEQAVAEVIAERDLTVLSVISRDGKRNPGGIAGIERTKGGE
jgi:hypothetical protein